MTFQKAVKYDAKLRLAIAGPSGSGKTYTALKMAGILSGDKRVALVDTEHGSASKYADQFDFDVLELAEFSPDTFVKAIKNAEEAGYGLIILDSLSHAWAGTGGLLDIVDGIARRSNSSNTFIAWKDATPIQNRMIDTIIASNIHVIATLRAKEGYALEKDEKTGKQVPVKKGMEPIQRDGVEYEFDVFAMMDINNKMTITKTRCPALTGKVYSKPDIEPAATLLEWLKGEKPPVAAPSTVIGKPRAQQLAAIASNGKRPVKTDTKVSVLPERPWSAEYIHEMLGKVIEKRYAGNIGEPNPKQLGLVVGLLGQDQERHVLLDYMFGIKSSRELKHCHVCALLDWLKPVRDGDSGPYRIDFTTEVERTSIVEQALRDAGQLPLPDDLPVQDGQNL